MQGLIGVLLVALELRADADALAGVGVDVVVVVVIMTTEIVLHPLTSVDEEVVVRVVETGPVVVVHILLRGVVVCGPHVRSGPDGERTLKVPYR